MNSKFSFCEPCLLSPLGELQSRVVMAAMTRGFCGPNHTATEQMANYYSRRASEGVGLILTEGTIIHSSADGYNNVPHIQTQEQTESWAKVVSKVHENGGKIFSQLWHCGRISHEDYTGGLPPLSSTDKPAAGINRQNNKPYGVPRKMQDQDFQNVEEQFINAARNAIDAGFDGIQLHFGHGYLIDQFYDIRVKDREDDHGGSIANRCRFSLQILDKVLEVVDSSKVMARISPSRDMGGIYEWHQLNEMIEYLLQEFDKSGLRMLDISCANADYFKTSGPAISIARSYWPHLLIGGASLSADQAQSEIDNGHLDMVTWGRALIANPNMISKFQDGTPLAEFNRDMLQSLE